MIWKNIFGRNPQDDTPYTLYGALVRQARSPELYLNMSVPDTAEGRFEMVALHTILVLRRLRAGGEPGKALGQKLFDVLFDDMDQTLREMGVGDLSVGKKIKALASSFYGRIDAYEKGLNEPAGDALEAALRRNVFSTPNVPAPHVAALADYVRRLDAGLLVQPVENIMAGRVTFPAPSNGVPPVAADLAGEA